MFASSQESLPLVLGARPQDEYDPWQTKHETNAPLWGPSTTAASPSYNYYATSTATSNDSYYRKQQPQQDEWSGSCTLEHERYQSSSASPAAWTALSWKHKQRQQPLILKITYCIVVVSWMISLSRAGKSQSVIRQATRHTQDLRTKRLQRKQELETIVHELEGQEIYLRNLQHTRDALQHEVKLLMELHDGDIYLPHTPNQPLIGSWLSHRQEGLKKRVQQLQEYVSLWSYVQAKDKFGPGPHRVRFTVNFSSPGMISLGKVPADDSHLIHREFTVELAPIDVMPHSTFFFLEMIHSGMWDKTAFLHQEKVDHVIAAVPMDFDTHQIKHQHVGILGWTSLAFHEYSDDWKHEKHTLGFSSVGPAWYVNSVNNVAAHGPGGQDYHVLDSDADPCFAKVVEGKDVVDDLIEFGLHSDNPTELTDWEDVQHSLTQIVKAEIVS